MTKPADSGKTKPSACRPLTPEERTRLVANRNRSRNWDQVSVRDPFDPDLILDSTFVGEVKLGRVRSAGDEGVPDELRLPFGITNCFVVSSVIGDDCAVHNARYIENARIGDRSVVFDVDEIRPGPTRSGPIRIALMNEAGGRTIVPFVGIRPADAYLWAKFRDDHELMDALESMTIEPNHSSGRSFALDLCEIGERVTITHCGALCGVRIGAHARIDGVAKLVNVTVESSAEQRTYIGDAAILTDGIVGYGCRVHRAAIAERFVFGENVKITNGARVIDSVIGDNSTVSCGEVLNTLAFPAHEQHHATSFLIAAVVMGQSNVAAGVTIGSNHNSRANDGEIEARRGFWPGLCVSLKHPSRFGSFTLIAKADYPAELDVPFPFSLVSDNRELNRLEIRPAYWWLHNMYALVRNAAKFRDRDTRVRKAQHIETEFLAPDTAEEILDALRLLDDLFTRSSESGSHERRDSIVAPETIGSLDSIDATGSGFERSRRSVVILHPHQAYAAYRQMLAYYAVRAIVTYIESLDDARDIRFATLATEAAHSGHTWRNLGGQIVREADLDRLRSDIASAELRSWDAIHSRYDVLRTRYSRECAVHATHVLGYLTGRGSPTLDDWHAACDDAITVAELIVQRVYETRKKDYDDTFRRITYRNEDEMLAVVGAPDDNSTVKRARSELDLFVDRVRTSQRRIV